MEWLCTVAAVGVFAHLISVDCVWLAVHGGDFPVSGWSASTFFFFSLTESSAVSSTSSKQRPSMLEMEEEHMDAQDKFYGNVVQPVGENYVEEV